MPIHFSRTDQTARVFFRVQRGGALVPGISSGSFITTVRDPGDSSSSTPSVTESGKSGVYFYEIPTSFLTTGGVGVYGTTIEISSLSPFVKTVLQDLINVTKQDIDTIADGGAGTFDRTTDTLEDIRDAISSSGSVDVQAIADAVWSAPSRTLTTLGALLSQVVNQAVAVTRSVSPLDGFLQRPLRDGSDGVFGFPGEIDIRAQLDKTLRERGHKVLLRSTLDQRCPKWDPDRNDAHPESCPHCWGGWAYKDIWVLTYRRPAFGPAAEGLTDEFRSIFGNFSIRHNLFYFKYDIAPSPQDGIIEVELDDLGEPKRAHRIARVWDIGIVHPFRDQFGRVEYWVVSAEERKLGK